MSTIKATTIKGVTGISFIPAPASGPIFPTDFTKARGLDVVMNGSEATFTGETEYQSNVATSNDFEITGTFHSGTHFLMTMRGQNTSYGSGVMIMFAGTDAYYGYDGGTWDGSVTFAGMADNDTYSFSCVGNVGTIKHNGNIVTTFTPHYATGTYTEFYVGANAVHSDLTFQQL